MLGVGDHWHARTTSQNKTPSASLHISNNQRHASYCPAFMRFNDVVAFVIRHQIAVASPSTIKPRREKCALGHGYENLPPRCTQHVLYAATRGVALQMAATLPFVCNRWSTIALDALKPASIVGSYALRVNFGSSEDKIQISRIIYRSCSFKQCS